MIKIKSFTTVVAGLAVFLSGFFFLGLSSSVLAFDDPLSQFSPPALLGQGEATIYLLDNPSFILANPAGLAGRKNLNLTSFYNQSFEDKKTYLAGVSFPLLQGSFSLSYLLSGIEGIDYATSVDEDGRPTAYATTSSQESEAAFGYGQKADLLKFGFFDEASFGGRFKFYNQTIGGLADSSSSGANLDFGLLLSKENFSFSLEQINCLPASLGGGLKWATGRLEKFSPASRLGLGLHFSPSLYLSSRLNLSWEGLPATASGGLEYLLFEALALRLGAKQAIDGQNAILNFTAGCGLKIGGFFFDYAFCQERQISSNSHSFSLGWRI